MSEKFFGKYRGVVINNVDPEQMGRIQAQVPDVSGGTTLGWAIPCAPSNLPKKVGSALPKVGSRVWIEFEAGDFNQPVWTGRWFDSAAETPPSLKTRT